MYCINDIGILWLYYTLYIRITRVFIRNVNVKEYFSVFNNRMSFPCALAYVYIYTTSLLRGLYRIITVASTKYKRYRLYRNKIEKIVVFLYKLQIWDINYKHHDLFDSSSTLPDLGEVGRGIELAAHVYVRTDGKSQDLL
jgi:hypothetical protein